MRTELMESAMCWDLAENVTATYAKYNDDFSYFCPHSICLQEVGAKQKVNAHFVARGRHVPGCPNEPAKVEGVGTATKPAKKVSKVAPPAIPTVLGPGKSSKQKRSKPSTAELLMLAADLKGKPPSCTGTMDEVVNAWLHLTMAERSETSLLINDERLNYKTGFYCLSELGDSAMEQFPCTRRIVHGTASIRTSGGCYWIESVKKFRTLESKLNLIIRVPIDKGATAKYIEECLAKFQGTKSFSLFYLGALPTLSASGKSFGISGDISNPYARFIVLPYKTV